jgi:hypothetical protein
MTRLMTNIGSAAIEPIHLLSAVAVFAGSCAIRSARDEAVCRARYLDRYLSNLEQLGDLAGELGYAGLQCACLVLKQNVEALRHPDRRLDKRVSEVLETWPSLVMSFLELPSGEGAGEALAAHLQLPVWAQPLEPEDAEMLRGLLAEERR